MGSVADFKEPSLAASAMFYIGLGLWWNTQTVKAYWCAIQRRIEFQSTASYMCCQRFRNAPVEGLVKLLSTLSVCAMSSYSVNQTTVEQERNQAVGQLTVFVMFTISCVWQIVTVICRRLTLSNVDYFFVLVCFNLQSVVFAYHSGVRESWRDVAHSCAMFAATGVGLAALFEYRYPQCIWLPLSRAFCAVVLGSWLAQIVFMSDSYHDINVTNSTMTDMLNVSLPKAVIPTTTLSTVDLIPLYFSWHCFIVMVSFVMLWLIIYKMCNKGWCCCVPVVEETHFENHVRFDYHFLDRMTDSDHD